MTTRKKTGVKFAKKAGGKKAKKAPMSAHRLRCAEPHDGCGQSCTRSVGHKGKHEDLEGHEWR